MLDLDFRGRHAGGSLLGYGSLAAGVALVLLTWQNYQSLQVVRSGMQSALEQRAKNSHRNEHLLPAVPVEQLREDSRQAQVITDQLALPWDELFTALEQSAVSDVALLTLQPDAKKRQVKIDAEAKDLTAALQYIDRLQASPVLDEVYLLRHDVNEADKQKPVRFSISARWKMTS